MASKGNQSKSDMFGSHDTMDALVGELPNSMAS